MKLKIIGISIMFLFCTYCYSTNWVSINTDSGTRYTVGGVTSYGTVTSTTGFSGGTGSFTTISGSGATTVSSATVYGTITSTTGFVGGNYSTTNGSMTFTNGAAGFGRSTAAEKVDVVGKVRTSSATVGSSIYLGGAFDAVPTSGYNAGTLIYETDTGLLYISTETVVADYSWVKVGAQ